MAFLDARCTSCGAALKVNGALDIANCQFCGAAFDVGSAVQYHFASLKALPVGPTAFPQAVAPTKTAKAALVCGLASCAGALLALVAGYASDAMYRAGGTAKELYGVVEVLAVLLGALGIFLAIAGFVCSSIAGKEPWARGSGFVSAGVITSVLGFLLSFIVIPVLIFEVF